MELIISENCTYKEFLEEKKDDIFNFLDKLISKYNPHKIQKIIIADNDYNNYNLTVKEMAHKLNQNGKISKNGASVVIAGINKNNKYVQYILVKFSIIYGFLNYGYNTADQYTEVYKFSYATLLHEIGHCIHYYILYSKYNYLTNIENTYDLNIKSELEEYIYHQCITLTSEYYAQRFMNNICDLKDDSADELLKIIDDDYFIDRKNSISKIYRLIYWFIFYISYYNTNSLKFELYEKIHNLAIRDNLKKLENELIRWYNEFETKRNNVKNIVTIFKHIYNAKYSHYDMI